MSEENSIILKTKKPHGILASIFCCKCFKCCQEIDQSLLTSNDRKKILNKLIKNTSDPQLYDANSQISDPIQILIGLYLSENDEDKNDQFMQNLLRCRINANYTSRTNQRDDVEYYIPQLCSFIAFQQEFKVQKMVNYIKQAGQINFYFAHLLYFYIRSLSYIVNKNEKYQLLAIEKMQLELFEFFSEHYQNKYLTAKELYKEINQKQNHNYEDQNGNYVAPNAEEQQIAEDIIQKYGTTEQDEIKQSPQFKLKSSNIILKNYKRKIIINENIQKNQKLFTNNQTQVSNPENIQDEMKGSFNIEQNGFASTINFFDDLINVSEQLKDADPKDIALRTYIKQINEKLPSAVYIPFFSQQVRNYVVLNIVPTECRVFSTKERSPYYICVEIYSPELEEAHELEVKQQKNNSQVRRIPDWKRQYALSKAQTVYEHFYQSHNNTQQSLRSGYQSEIPPSKSAFQDVYMQTIEKNQQRYSRMSISNQHQFELIEIPEKIDKQNGIACAYEPQEDQMKDSKSTSISSSTVQESSQIQNHNTINGMEQHIHTINEDSSTQDMELHTHVPHYINMNGQKQHNDTKEIEIIPNGEKINTKTLSKKLFGEDQADQEKRIKKKSPYAHFKSWKLVHFIVKTGDNLKQEQFAQQLIYQFDQIFKDSELNLILRPYEIISLGPNCGIIEVVKNSVTFDSLIQKLNTQQKGMNLQEFFKTYYGSGLYKAQKNFCSSLAAYSLVCYFLQIKDRHNGNILLHRDGYICHIDFGFLLSNAPGQGVGFELNVPFKLLTDYINVLGGVNSDLFKQFRQLFHKGFMAARKNQDKILILVKMFYSSHGASLPCFEKGEDAIKALEERFNPKNIKLENEYFVHTNQLIDQSLDNWKSRWYDKWQYFCQGIFY
ncbi:hypothetical protein ABPG72_001914 [Tetrahymena utriculariae]